MSTTPEQPAPERARITFVVLAIGLGLVMLFAYAAESLFDRAPGGAFFFVVPVIGFLVPMVLTALRVPRERRGLVLALSLVSAVIAAGALIAFALLQVTGWLPWVGAALAATVVGLAAAFAAGDA